MKKKAQVDPGTRERVLDWRKISEKSKNATKICLPSTNLHAENIKERAFCLDKIYIFKNNKF